jgi:hypothetical protein
LSFCIFQIRNKLCISPVSMAFATFIEVQPVLDAELKY